MIVGIDTLSRWGAVIDCSCGRLKLRGIPAMQLDLGGDTQVMNITATGGRIPARSHACIRIKAYKFQPGDEVLVEPKSDDKTLQLWSRILVGSLADSDPTPGTKPCETQRCTWRYEPLQQQRIVKAVYNGATSY